MVGSSLFIGIMSASQIKALNISVNSQVAVAIGFRTATLVLAGLCLSFALRLGNKKLSLSSDLSLEDEKVNNF